MHWHYLRALLHTQCWRECTAERGEGKQPLPQRCAPSSEAVEQQACTQCGARDWQTDSPCTQPSLAFLRAAVVNVLFVFFTCGTPGCTGLLQVSILLHLSSCCACFCGGRGLILIFDSLVYRWTAKSMACSAKAAASPSGCVLCTRGWTPCQRAVQNGGATGETPSSPTKCA